MEASVEPLGQCGDDALGAADVTEPITVLVLHHLANELGAVDSFSRSEHSAPAERLTCRSGRALCYRESPTRIVIWLSPYLFPGLVDRDQFALARLGLESHEECDLQCLRQALEG
jgi:hypothetical protein